MTSLQEKTLQVRNCSAHQNYTDNICVWRIISSVTEKLHRERKGNMTEEDNESDKEVASMINRTMKDYRKELEEITFPALRKCFPNGTSYFPKIDSRK